MQRYTNICFECREASRTQIMCRKCGKRMVFLKQNTPRKSNKRGWKEIRKFYESRPWLRYLLNLGDVST